MARFSFRPALTLRGRTFKGLRGWSGKPLHPPLTDVPVGAYVLAAVFDVISAVGHDHSWARDFYRAATFTLVGGVAVGLLAAATGFADWLRSTEAGTQARRTANAHAVTMLTVTVVVLVDIVLRTTTYRHVWHPSARDRFPGDKHTETSETPSESATAAR